MDARRSIFSIKSFGALTCRLLLVVASLAWSGMSMTHSGGADRDQLKVKDPGIMNLEFPGCLPAVKDYNTDETCNKLEEDDTSEYMFSPERENEVISGFHAKPGHWRVCQTPLQNGLSLDAEGRWVAGNSSNANVQKIECDWSKGEVLTRIKAVFNKNQLGGYCQKLKWVDLEKTSEGSGLNFAAITLQWNVEKPEYITGFTNEHLTSNGKDIMSGKITTAKFCRSPRKFDVAKLTTRSTKENCPFFDSNGDKPATFATMGLTAGAFLGVMVGDRNSRSVVAQIAPYLTGVVGGLAGEWGNKLTRIRRTNKFERCAEFLKKPRTVQQKKDFYGWSRWIVSLRSDRSNEAVPEVDVNDRLTGPRKHTNQIKFEMHGNKCGFQKLLSADWRAFSDYGGEENVAERCNELAAEQDFTVLWSGNASDLVDFNKDLGDRKMAIVILGKISEGLIDSSEECTCRLNEDDSEVVVLAEDTMKSHDTEFKVYEALNRQVVKLMAEMGIPPPTLILDGHESGR